MFFLLNAFFAKSRVQCPKKHAWPHVNTPNTSWSLRRKIFWTLVFKLSIITALYFVFKKHKQSVNPTQVAQKLLQDRKVSHCSKEIVHGRR
ncbi:cytochrome oxidase putative small subunit CydP [Candidatus Hepatobacter penaei]|uniref:cytochrome oxidase putative small subunit CydP n=1 Tax=Candidatus Hepatobacter penaei TaxID=1274402 RepID=UPI0004F39FD7